MEIIGLPGLTKKYNRGDNFFRTILCRPEFNQFRTQGFFIFNNSKEFILLLEKIIETKSIRTKNRWRSAIYLFVFLWFGNEIAFCQQYQPVIIYSPSGEPQSIIKGKIIYNSFGFPKKYSTNGGYTK